MGGFGVSSIQFYFGFLEFFNFGKPLKSPNIFSRYSRAQSTRLQCLSIASQKHMTKLVGPITGIGVHCIIIFKEKVGEYKRAHNHVRGELFSS